MRLMGFNLLLKHDFKQYFKYCHYNKRTVK